MADLSQMKSISQARAKFAWECAGKYNPLDTDSEQEKRRKKKEKSEYSAVVDKVPTYIKTNGLLNTLAFLYSKDSGKNGEVLKNICDWLADDTKNEYHLIPSMHKSKINLLNYLLDKQTSDARFLIQCTTEVLALFNWLRRFAKTD